MASMFNLPSIRLPSLSSLFRPSPPSSTTTKLPPNRPITIETSRDKLARTLKHLIKANHSNHSILYSHDRYHNHLPHALGAAYLFSPAHSTSEGLHAIYEAEKVELEEWRDSPAEIARAGWRGHLGNTEYQRAYVDFFEDELARTGYDWKRLVVDYLLDEEGGPPLINGVLGGLAHPAIHLGYAFELGSRDVAMEGLGLIACCWPAWHKYFDRPFEVPAGLSTTSDVIGLIEQIREDTRFSDNPRSLGPSSSGDSATSREKAILEYWYRWEITDPAKQIVDCFVAAIQLLVATHQASHTAYDFFLCHLLTGLWAVRVLMSELPASTPILLLRQWWMVTIRIYAAQRCPPVHASYIDDYDVKGKDWKWVEHQGLAGTQARDPHYVKALRVMRDCNGLFRSKDDFYLKAACKFGSEFTQWGGFGEGPRCEGTLIQDDML